MNVKSARPVLLWGLLLLCSATVCARGPLRASDANTSGWDLMTPQERLAHQTRIRGFKTLEDCRSYQAEHHQAMLLRAQAQGVALNPKGRDFCVHLPADTAGNAAPR